MEKNCEAKILVNEGKCCVLWFIYRNMEEAFLCVVTCRNKEILVSFCDVSFLTLILSNNDMSKMALVSGGGKNEEEKMFKFVKQCLE